MTLWGVNGESTGSFLTAWQKDKKWGNLISLLISLVDQLGLTIYLNKDGVIGFEDHDDGQGPKQQMTAVIRELAAALSLAGVDQSVITAIVTELKAALSNPNSQYDLEVVKQLIQKNGITLDQLKGLKDLKGDKLIAKLITILGGTEFDCLPQTTKDAYSALETLLSKESKTPAEIDTAMTKLTASFPSGTAVVDYPTEVKGLLAEARGAKELIETSSAKRTQFGKDLATFTDQELILAAQGKAIPAVTGAHQEYLAEEVAAYLLNVNTQEKIGKAIVSRLSLNPEATLAPEVYETISNIISFGLTPSQRLVSYTDKEDKTQIVLVERKQGKWTCPSIPAAQVSFNRKGEMQLKLPGQLLPVKADWVADGAEHYFAEQGVPHDLFKQIFTDGIIDRQDWQRIADLDGDGVAELTGRAYSFFSNGGLVGLDGDDGITGEDLEGVFTRTIGSLLDKLDEDGNEAGKTELIRQYLTAKSFVLVPAGQAADIVMGRTGQSVTAGEVASKYIAADADMQLTFKNTVLLVTKQEYKDDLSLSKEDLTLIFAFLGAFAQMPNSSFGTGQPFENYKVKRDNLEKCKDNTPLEDVNNFMLWLKGKEVSSASSSGGSRTQQDAALKAIYNRENRKNPENQIRLGASYMQGQTEDPMKAYEFYMAAIAEGTREYIPGMKGNPEAVKALVEVLTSNEDPALYAKALGERARDGKERDEGRGE